MPTIATQLFRSVVPSIVIALAVGGLVLDVLIGERLEDDFDAVLATKVQSLVALTELENGELELERYDQVLPGYADPLEPDYFVMLDPEGSVLARSPSLEASDWLVVPDDVMTHGHRDLVLPDGRHGRTLDRRFVPSVDDDDDEEGEAVSEPYPVTLHLAVSREPLDALRASVRVLLIGTGLVLVAAIVLLARRRIRSTLAPLEHLGEQMARLDLARLGQRLSLETGSHELERLTARFNELLARLDAALHRERRFSADVAHELRTPLAELKTLGEVSSRWPDDPDLHRSFLSDHAAAVTRMERTVTTLLALARSESSVDGLDVPVDLVELVRRAGASVETRMNERALTLRATLPDEPVVCAGEAQWQSVIGNLFENAAEYADPGSAVEIVLDRVPGNGTWRLLVSNRSDELAAEDLPQLFERLWRKDKARHSGRHGGLGLSLVKACARQLGVEIHPELGPGGRFTMSVAGIVPLARESASREDEPLGTVPPPPAFAYPRS